MLFPHKPLLAVRSFPPTRRRDLARHAKAFAAGQAVPSDWPDLFNAFLQELPPACAMEKIAQRLSRMARTHGTRLTDFFWWDIVGKQRSLIATLHHKKAAFTIAFFWKKTEKKTEKNKKIDKTFGYCSFVPDKDAIQGRRLDIEGGTYQEMKASFEAWLSKTF